MLTGRTILITNAVHFVGPAAARALQDAGATVFCHDRSFAEADPRDQFTAAHPGVIALSEQGPGEMVAAVLAARGQIDVLINNDAFPALRAPVEDASLEDFRATLEGLLVFPFAMAAAVAPGMKARNAGRILFLTSAAPLRGLPNYSMYASARGGANALALSLAKELAPHNILVNAIAPNYVESPTYFPDSLLADPAALAKMQRNIPLKRLGKPEEVAALVVFFASEQCGFVTGHVLPVAGGWA